MPNRLINETSPYLLQHAHNPVDWYSWGDEAFAKAKAENKPVLVSIGYAACHWCHVMEHESFENPEIAAKMNELFVSIKVDREERPDIDAIYMQALISIAGHGGWPLNVFLMPDGRPFYGGTYFPNTDRGRMPSWPRVLDSVADAFKNQPDLVADNAKTLTHALQVAAEEEAPNEPITADIADTAYRGLANSFDADNGGFGGAPKFPQTMPQEFLLRYHLRTGDAHARELVEHSLERMAAGGIYDHLGGGFARYSTDDQWLVPHFEKMLYDNALLATIYTQAYQLTGDHGFRTVAQETLDYLLRDLSHANGAFFSSQDADSEEVEGKYYV
ncbi:MAG: thioredoxin domain-containing protein, partial [Chloroflexi bacterium]|nr:thioredoxin domain-containing protein [Chloroflexota bacterium]